MRLFLHASAQNCVCYKRHPIVAIDPPVPSQDTSRRRLGIIVGGTPRKHRPATSSPRVLVASVKSKNRPHGTNHGSGRPHPIFRASRGRVLPRIHFTHISESPAGSFPNSTNSSPPRMQRNAIYRGRERTAVPKWGSASWGGRLFAVPEVKAVFLHQWVTLERMGLSGRSPARDPRFSKDSALCLKQLELCLPTRLETHRGPEFETPGSDGLACSCVSGGEAAEGPKRASHLRLISTPVSEVACLDLYILEIKSRSSSPQGPQRA